MPDDWLYVNNFQDPDRPKALQLPAGKGRELKADMEHFGKDLQTEVPQAFEEKKYQQEQEKLQQDFQSKARERFEEFQERAEAAGFQMAQTPVGLAPSRGRCSSAA